MRLTTLIPAAFALALATAAVAEPPMDEDRMARHLDHMTKELGLNDQQQAQLQELMAAHHARVKASHDQLHEGLMALLTPEQKAKFDEMHADKGEHRKGRGHGDGKRDGKRDGHRH